MNIGDKFFKQTFDHNYYDFCKNCGKKRDGEGWSGSNNCTTCGTSYSYTTKKIAPIYVIGTGVNFKGEKFVQLSEKTPEELLENPKSSYSYYSYEENRLGVDFYKTKKGATNTGVVF